MNLDRSFAIEHSTINEDHSITQYSDKTLNRNTKMQWRTFKAIIRFALKSSPGPRKAPR